MNNHVTASVEFFFKGKKIAASVDIDLDQAMESAGELPALYPLLARAAELDLYSYEYEIMQAEEIVFSNASGIAADHVHDGVLDRESFTAAWREQQLLGQLQQIAQRHLSVDNLQQQPALKAALLEAWRLGKASS